MRSGYRQDLEGWAHAGVKGAVFGRSMATWIYP
jgi:hypothetical protein